MQDQQFNAYELPDRFVIQHPTSITQSEWQSHQDLQRQQQQQEQQGQQYVVAPQADNPYAADQNGWPQNHFADFEDLLNYPFPYQQQGNDLEDQKQTVFTVDEKNEKVLVNGGSDPNSKLDNGGDTSDSSESSPPSNFILTSSEGSEVETPAPQQQQAEFSNNGEISIPQIKICKL